MTQLDPAWKLAVDCTARALREGSHSPAPQYVARMSRTLLRTAAVALLEMQAREQVRHRTALVERTIQETEDRDDRERDILVNQIHDAIGCNFSTHYKSQAKRRLCVGRIADLPDAERQAAIDERRAHNDDDYAEEDRRWSNLNRRLDQIIEEWKTELHQEWTADLLASRIAMRDGSYTTWGEATIEQHQERLAIFSDNAEANLEGAARHSAAIDALEAAGVPTLNDMVAQEGAA